MPFPWFALAPLILPRFLFLCLCLEYLPSSSWVRGPVTLSHAFPLLSLPLLRFQRSKSQLQRNNSSARASLSLKLGLRNPRPFWKAPLGYPTVIPNLSDTNGTYFLSRHVPSARFPVSVQDLDTLCHQTRQSESTLPPKYFRSIDLHCPRE